MNVETITWHPVSEPPDSNRNVLMFEPDSKLPVWPGYFDQVKWRDAEGMCAYPTHWSELPSGPRS